MAEPLDLAALLFATLSSKKLPSADRLLSSIKQTEKRTFPTNEAFDFDTELKKRTTTLHYAYRNTSSSDGSIELCGYSVYVRSKLVTRIHKICVVEKYRRQGIGRWIMERTLNELAKASANKVDLWVDADRLPARRLYASCGFHEMETVQDYYSPRRHGIRLEMSLEEGWRERCRNKA